MGRSVRYDSTASPSRLFTVRGIGFTSTSETSLAKLVCQIYYDSAHAGDGQPDRPGTGRPAYGEQSRRDEKAGTGQSLQMRKVRPSLLERTHIMSVELNAYLFFPGNAEQAIAFYQRVFGGQVTITRRGDIDPTATPEQRNQVINAQLIGGDITLRASDRQDTSTEPQTRIELSLIGTDDARMRALFDGLADGGTVRAKLEKQFWGDVFGAVTDRYGIGWQINIGTAGA